MMVEVQYYDYKDPELKAPSANACRPVGADVEVRVAIAEVVAAEFGTAHSSPRSHSPTPGDDSTSSPGHVGRWLETVTSPRPAEQVHE